MTDTLDVLEIMESQHSEVDELLGSDERAAIGNDVLAMFEALIEREPRFQVRNETAAAAPLPGV